MAKEYLVGSDGYNKKFKRETLLNYGMNRWGLNKASSVGSTSELIRNCAPSKYEEWVRFYFSNATQKKKEGQHITEEYIKDLGQTLYTKLSEVVHYELNQISEEECIEYAYNLIINRTYEGYITEIETIYGQLEELIGMKIESASDDWDRRFNVDFFLKIKDDKFIGFQIKPIASGITLNQYQWIEMHKKNHEKFSKIFGGKVFFIYSTKNSSGKKEIFNKDVIEEIKSEIVELSN